MLGNTAPAYEISGTIEPTRLSGAYRLGLLVVAITMLVLPLLYLGLIAVVGAIVWWHATANTWILTARGGGWWKFVAYVGPLVAGVVLVFFMVKPVLARPARRIEPIPIDPRDEPILFGFIDQICRQVRAPVPSRVQVDCQINASASFATLPIALGAPRLVLTIGLPLAAGLTVRQFGGVVAHEFGHFAQGGGMRLTYLVRSINGWFSRVVYERDAWDEKLDEWSQGGAWVVALTLSLAKASVWCSRHVLAGLMKAGHAISCFMLRQMEYDADSYEVKLVGTEAFIETSARLREMNVFAEVGHNELREGWLRRAVPSNLPAFVIGQRARFAPELLGRVREVPDAKTGPFDTHPSDGDRIDAARNPESAGVLIGGDSPAAVLFRNFATLSERATRHYYEHDLGLDLTSAALVDTDAALVATHGREKTQRAAQEFFGDRLSVLRPLRVDIPPEGATTPPELVAALREAQVAMASEEGRVAEKYRGFDSLEHARQLALMAMELMESGFQKVVPEGFNLTEGTNDEASTAAARAVAQQERLAPALARFESIATRRLACAVALLNGSLDDSSTPIAAIDRATRAALGEEAERLRSTLNALAGVWTHLNAIHECATLYEHLSANAAKSPKPDRAMARMNRASARLGAAVREIRTKLAGLAGPDTDVDDALLTMIGVPADPSAHVEAGLVLAKTAALRFDVIGRLASIALRVEEAIAAESAAGS